MTQATDPGEEASPTLWDLGPALAVENFTKFFGSQRALDGVSFEIAKSEIVALLGENGSGKSTLVKILAGYHVPEQGSELRLGGEAVPLPVPSGHFREIGLSFVFQDLGLAPGLTVVENLYVGHRAARDHHPRRPIRWRAERRLALQGFARYGIDIDPGALVRDLRPTEQALLAIARAAEDLREFRERTTGGSGVLVLDEPTVFLPETEKVFLLELVRRVAALGTAVLFVSHDLTSVRDLCRRALILRDGMLVADVGIPATTDEELVRLISAPLAVDEPFAGGSRQRHLSRAATVNGAPVVALEVNDLRAPLLQGVRFTLHKGEVLGIAGLLGSGSELLPYALFGALADVQGTMASRRWNGDLSRMTPRRAISAGFALVPADRQRQGVVGTLSVEKNLLSLVLGDYWHRGMLSYKGMRKTANERVNDFRVRPADPTRDMVSLSGGNQQKVVLARWLERHPTVLLLHEPTQGVDVATRAEIYRIVEGLAQQGTAVLWVTTDFEELAAVSDRVLVIDAGLVAKELDGPNFTRDEISSAVYAISASPVRAG